MQLLTITDAFTAWVQVLSALIAVILAIYFFAAYKSYRAEVQRRQLLDQFLNDQ